ncbi:unnamed protein product, partial [marine sediment metagenome]
IYAQNAHAYVIEEAEATHLMNYGEGFWAETTLHVTLYIYQGGARSFFYSETHRQSKPWYSTWSITDNFADLYEESSGVWTARNRREVVFFWPLPYVATIETCVHFNENNMNFYYSDAEWNNGALVAQHMWNYLMSFY